MLLSAFDLQKLKELQESQRGFYNGKDRNVAESGHRNGECPMHGPLHSLRRLVGTSSTAAPVALPDVPEWLRDLPREVCLCTSTVPGLGYGICAAQRIPQGTWIGPFQGVPLLLDKLHSGILRNSRHLWEFVPFCLFTTGLCVWDLTSLRFISIRAKCGKIVIILCVGLPYTVICECVCDLCDPSMIRVNASLIRMSVFVIRVSPSMIRVSPSLIRVSVFVIRVSPSMIRIRVSVFVISMSTCMIRVSPSLICPVYDPCECIWRRPHRSRWHFHTVAAQSMRVINSSICMKPPQTDDSPRTPSRKGRRSCQTRVTSAADEVTGQRSARGGGATTRQVTV
ncbi:hypothetical protein WMY93_004255 [Mugilogobius chulae]|uniref:Uncharacterized protein n=1 Tax=Mugilogobius chulae TaxID=88201 RepID=A0AAW0PQJ3_9GOBI